MQQLAQHAAAYGLQLTTDQLAQFETYRALLIDWNQQLNLTRIIEPEAIVIRHFLDSLSCALATGDLNGQRLIDVGTGAGFPGLALKIAFPQLQLTLSDSVAKKARFLEEVVAQLGLTDVQVVAERAELLGRVSAQRGAYDWAVGRAVAQLRVLVEYLLPLVRVGGATLALKGATAAAECVEAANAIALLGGEPPQLRQVALPDVAEAHYLVVVRKVAPTPDAYPRRPGRPSKRPL